MNRIKLAPAYFPNPTIGRPISNGELYIGEVDLDPEVVANQKQVYAQQEDGTRVAMSQPISLDAGGTPIHNGSPVTLFVSDDYALKVLDKLGAQVYYVPSQVEITSPEDSFCYPNYQAVDQGAAGALQTIYACILAIGANAGTIVLRNNNPMSATTVYTLSTDITIPSNIVIKIENGALLSIDSTKTFTVNGFFSAGLYQVFSGDGSVSFGTGAIEEVYPEWFGAIANGSTDSSLAIQKAVDASLASSIRFTFSNGEYYISTQINVVSQNGYDSFYLSGQGAGNTKLYNEVANGSLFRFYSTGGVWKSVIIKDLEVATTTFPASSDVFYIGAGTLGGGIFNCYLHGTGRTGANEMAGNAITLENNTVDSGIVKNFSVKECTVVFFDGSGILSLGTGTAGMAFNCIIAHNDIEDCHSGGIVGCFDHTAFKNNIIAYCGKTSGGGMNIYGHGSASVDLLFEGNGYEHNDVFDFKVDRAVNIDIMYNFHARVAVGTFDITTTQYIVLGTSTYGIRHARISNSYLRDAQDSIPRVTGITVDSTVEELSLDHVFWAMLSTDTKLDITTDTSLTDNTSNENIISKKELGFAPDGSNVSDSSIYRAGVGGLIVKGGICNYTNAVVPVGGHIVIDCKDGWNMTVNMIEELTVDEPSNAINGAKMTFIFRQLTGNHYTITWDAAFKVAAPVTIATSKYATITFAYLFGSWFEVSRVVDLS